MLSINGSCWYSRTMTWLSRLPVCRCLLVPSSQRRTRPTPLCARCVKSLECRHGLFARSASNATTFGRQSQRFTNVISFSWNLSIRTPGSGGGLARRTPRTAACYRHGPAGGCPSSMLTFCVPDSERDSANSESDTPVGERDVVDCSRGSGIRVIHSSDPGSIRQRPSHHHGWMTLLMGNTGYTSTMKTAISVPDELFAQADALAERLGWNRSQLFAHAMREFLERQGEDPVTHALDAIADELGAQSTPNAARALIESGAWEW